MTEYEFYLLLRTRFNAKEFALLPQVRNGTGFRKSPRTADAIAISLWPSRGVYAHGFEFKNSRTDWLKELSQPEKADEIGKNCAYWSVVVSDTAIVKDGELPPAWGLILASDKGLKTIKDAPRRDAAEPGWLFVAAVLRAAVGVVTDETLIQKRIDAAVRKANDEKVKRSEEREKSLQEKHNGELAELHAKIADFETASGIKIETWRNSYGENRKIGEAVALVLRGGLRKEIAALETAMRRFDDIRKVADEFRALCEVIEVEKKC